jgi:hypothetical protein
MLGFIVRPISKDFQLRSGCGYYSEAVCIADEPFVLVSKEGDMKWKATVNSGEIFAYVNTPILKHLSWYISYDVINDEMYAISSLEIASVIFDEDEDEDWTLTLKAV